MVGYCLVKVKVSIYIVHKNLAEISVKLYRRDQCSFKCGMLRAFSKCNEVPCNFPALAKGELHFCTGSNVLHRKDYMAA